MTAKKYYLAGLVLIGIILGVGITYGEYFNIKK